MEQGVLEPVASQLPEPIKVFPEEDKAPARTASTPAPRGAPQAKASKAPAPETTDAEGEPEEESGTGPRETGRAGAPITITLDPASLYQVPHPSHYLSSRYLYSIYR